MNQTGSILLADDEETFRESTSRLLRQEGFQCDTTGDARAAIELLKQKRYDVLLTDIRMPHNPDLWLVRESQQLDPRMPIVLVTAYPTTETAIQSVHMSVSSYLTKPIEIDELLGHIRRTIRHSSDRRTLRAIHGRLKTCLDDLEANMTRPRAESGELVSLATVRAVASCLSQLLELGGGHATPWPSHNVCYLLDCPQQACHREGIEKAIRVLAKTKNTFKSKLLAELRVELEDLLTKSDNSYNGSRLRARVR